MSELTDEQASYIQSPIAPEHVTYVESKGYVVSVAGGGLVFLLARAFLFRIHHPNIFYAALACVLGVFLIATFLFPPTLILSRRGLKSSSFGFLIADFPWSAVETISIFRTPVVQTLNSRPVGGRRAIGFNFRRGFEGRVRPRKGAYGYDAFVVAVWNAPLDVIAEQCLAYWRAAGGHGDVVDTLRQPPSGRLVEES